MRGLKQGEEVQMPHWLDHAWHEFWTAVELAAKATAHLAHKLAHHHHHKRDRIGRVDFIIQ